ncbi:MAG: ATP-binding cassette domain-containing protein [Akkermansia sp.]|nr:ATP-binding cassette domain-containing protein [Akkermansia sp.]
MLTLRRLRLLSALYLQGARRRFLRYRSAVVTLFSYVPHRLAAKEESRRAHAGTIADLFASIMARVDGLGIDKMDTAMDILRHDFPNVEHIWLAERFQRAYEARYPLSATLTLAAAQRTKEERISLALEIFALLHRVGGDLTQPTLFAEVTDGLDLHGDNQAIAELIRHPGTEAPRPIESISFAPELGPDSVLLPKEDEGVRFRALRCVNILLIVNDGATPIIVRGQTLRKGGVLPLATGQTVETDNCYFTYATIQRLLQTRYAGVKLVGYLQLEGDHVTLSRQRPLNCIARVRFGIHVEIDVLRQDAYLELDGAMLSHGDSVCTSYYTPFSVRGLGPFTFADISDSDSTGRSFQLDPGNRKVIVTNLPYMNRPGVLMLTPGLAPGAVFEVTYSRHKNMGTIRVLEGSSHTLTVGDVPVRGEMELKDGDLIGLSTVQFLRCRFSEGMLEEEACTITELKVRGLTKDYLRGRRVVDNILFTLKRGEMACVLGPSGSGKSTLLSMLAGHTPASFGTIRYNDELMTPEAQDLRRHIAFIPREDILDESMTVGEHVYQASIARRPRLSHADRMRRVLTVLNFVGIAHLANRNVGRAGERTISDGERTRLNLGLDLTGTAEVFLIDEPISGLSSGDSERVIDTIEKMSHGRIVLCTLHRPAHVLLNRFHKVMVLDSHGQMAFWGTPDEMMRYFREAAAEMHLHVSQEAQQAGGADYVFEVLEAPSRRIGRRRSANNSFWQERFEKSAAYAAMQAEQGSEPDEDEAPPAVSHRTYIPAMPRRTPRELVRLFRMWVSRTLLARIRSRMGMYAMLMEGPVLALLIAGTLRASYDTPYTFYKSLHLSEYLFLSLVLAMFFGLTDAACEILKDRPILRRESNYKIFTHGYLLAKTLVLTGIAGLQCALYLVVSHAILEIHHMFWPHFGVMLLTAFVGIALSLMVSAFVRSDRTALNVVPLLLVPQILLAGALVRFEEMNEFTVHLPDGLVPAAIERPFSNLRHRVAYQDETTHNITSKPVPLIAEFCPLRYAFEMIFVLQTEDNLWDAENERVNTVREALKDSNGSEDQLRFINRAALAFNGSAADYKEAEDLLRRVRKAALSFDEAFLERLQEEESNRTVTPTDQPAEFFFSNRKLASIREGVKTARKDERKDERRGFYLSPRQARPFLGFDQETDIGSVSTITRDAIYLFLMGLFPILLAGWRMGRIARGK